MALLGDVEETVYVVEEDEDEEETVKRYPHFTPSTIIKAGGQSYNINDGDYISNLVEGKECTVSR
ncbi:hypothetical protein DH86_00001128 [Scytalidium sp. 3C]|nr:hypothetical protein DH86_00001128 [Scytalidium sp. 3C]